MSNSFYTHGAFPSTGSAATSASMRAELDLISAGFDKMPTLSGNANLFVVINSTGTGLTQTSTLPSATFTDTLFTIQDDGDNTRKFQFNASTVTPGATRIYSVPDANTTLVGTDTTQTLTNKTLTAPVISSIVNTGSLSLPTSTDTLVGRATTDTLTNKTLTSPVIATIVNTGTLTLPTSTDTLVGRATTDTLTNKTLTSPVIGTIVNTGTLTLPTSTDTLVGRATTDTLTNKTLTSPVIGTIVNTGTLTLPTSTDTLVGRATTDTLTNKTLTSPVIGTIVNTGTLTLPTSTDTLVGRATTDTLTNKTLGAFTISGTVSGGGNQINNVIIGASTPLAGSFTTLSTTGLASLPSTGRSAAAALTVTNPAFLYGVASTYTDTASSGVIAAMAPFYSISGPTLSTSNVTTYTNAATLYIANAPTAGGSATITNPYSLYINAGAAYFGGAVTFAGSASLAGLTVTSLTNSGLTTGRVVYTTTGGLETSSANLTFNGTTLTANTIGAFTLSGTVAGGGNQINNVIIGTSTPLAGAFTTLTASTSITNSGLTTGRVVYSTTGGLETDSANLLYSGTDLTVYGITVGRGAGAVSTNTAVGASALASNSVGSDVTAVGYNALTLSTGGYSSAFGSAAGASITSGVTLDAFGYQSLNLATGNNNVAFGANSARNTTTGSSNVAVGREALYSNTTASSSTAVGYQAGYTGNASNNTAVGYQSLYSATNGNHTAIGYRAGYGQTTGSFNVFVGYQAGLNATTLSNCTITGYGAVGTGIATGTYISVYGTSAGASLTSGSYVDAFGVLALNSNTTGSYNVAFGTSALQANTTASYNTAVGYQAGLKITTDDNIFVGYRSGYEQTTGTQNTYIGNYITYGGSAGASTGSSNTSVGYKAGYTMGSGSYNTALGTQALNSNTTASYNTAVGYQAGYANATGVNMVALGYQAGYNSTGNSNVFIGYQAGFTKTSGGNNTIIGTAAGYSVTTGTGNTFVGVNDTTSGCGYSMISGSKNTIIGGFTGSSASAGLYITTEDNWIVLSDGAGNPTISAKGTTGQVYLQQYGSTNRFTAIKQSNFGYSTAYGALVIGATSGTNQTVCINVDPIANPSGSFSGLGGEVMFRNGATITQPNAANTGYQNLMVFETNGSGVRFNQSIGVGATSPATTGAGITFPATQSSSSDVNTLDDYEEGTWTPRLTGSTGGNYTPSGGNGGRYVKIGKMVYTTLTLEWNAQVTAYSGLLGVSGLPFTSSGTYRWSGSIAAVNNGLAFTAGYGEWMFIVDPGLTIAYIIQGSITGSGYSHGATVSSTGLVYSMTLAYEASA